MANNDKIYMAYKGDLGEKLKKATCQRIDWIISKAEKSKNILDIGCSQGIISLLLAEAGKKVIGIDIQKESIEFACDLLNTKYQHVKDNVEFICSDFMSYENKNRFDCIIITEVIEHLEYPDLFIARAKEFLSNDGIIILTVPFGVSNHPDHLSTFYMSNFYELVNRFLKIEDIYYMERWMGTIAYNTEYLDSEFFINKASVKKLEENFLIIDREMTKKIEELYNNSNNANKKYRASLDVYNELKSSYNISNNRVAEFKVQNNEYKDKLIECINELEKDEQLFLELRKHINKLETQISYLTHENSEYRRKIKIIKDTLIGKIGIRIYRVLQNTKAKIRKK